MKKFIIYRFVFLLPLFALLIAVSYAWFISFNTSLNNIIATTGNISMNANLYQMSDFNLDGVLDTDNEGNYIASQITSISIDNLNPGEEYTYRMDVENTGNINSDLSLYLSDFSGELADVLYIQVIDPSGFDPVFLNGKTGSVTLCNNIPLLVNHSISIFFKIKFASVEELDDNNISYNNSLESLNYYQSKQFDISKITVNLTQQIE